MAESASGASMAPTYALPAVAQRLDEDEDERDEQKDEQKAERHRRQRDADEQRVRSTRAGRTADGMAPPCQ